MTTTNQTGNHSNDPIERLVDLKDQVAQRVDSLGSLMKDHPFAALGIGLGLGYLIARLVHR